MKQTIIFILSIIIITLSLVLSKYFEYKEKDSEIKGFNSKYEQYANKEIAGIDIATIINQAVDDNEKAYIKKDEKGKYIQNDEDSINIEVKITDLSEEKIYTMETLYNGGISEFVRYYGQINFKCSKIDYNKNGHVKYMLFEQISS